MENITAKEEKKEVNQKADMLLSDDKLEQVAGGYSGHCSYWPVCRLYGTSQCLGDECLHVQEAEYQ